MTTLTALTSEKHGDLRVIPSSRLQIAQAQHVINVKANEVALSASTFPVFITRNPSNGRLALTAVLSFEEGKNLFTRGGGWSAIFEPVVLRTYPLFLMATDSNEKGYCVGIDEASNAFSREDGERLFDDSGQPSHYHDRVFRMLEAGIADEEQTNLFLHKVDELGLIKPVDLLVTYASGEAKTIQGLITVDEDRLKTLSAEQVAELNSSGYLFTLHALLMSLSQLNRLIRLNNSDEELEEIRQAKLQVARDQGSATEV